MKVSSSNPIIPGEELEGWSSWSPNALDGLTQRLTPVQLMELAQQRRRQQEQAQAESAVEPASAEGGEAAEAADGERAVSGYPTAAELEAIHQEAWQSGHEAGLEAGRAAGYQEGLTAGREQGLAEVRAEQEARFAEAWQPLQQLAEGLAQQISRFETELSADWLALALELAGQLSHGLARQNPLLIQELLREALDDLPATLAQARLRLNPADLEVAREFLAQETPETQWQWIEDPEVERGGCVIDTAALRLDLTMGTRIAAMRKALGMDDEPPAAD
ncbi:MULTISPECIES: flagellar assembly protein FliH [Chromobacterium]|uniref:Flagellar assembly protein FliH n=2 Tax=Chromobacterium TaxID=535 RepID=A0ABS3GQ01_9NEIS|nr:MULTISPECIES: flagellar assembly protein FliH [Chromobacterium]AXT47078.1 flagellar assembly protein FliH [Chromobacterium rhizoryzae]MBK0415716.1 flagellar assembly protein FliH [Chromobacterium haemolyticum]MBO0417130.1 flagellar assembly protein FliH [Chromobacterium haemolyticum]MBO0500159.1 flagellar assembly protein FliH [Chromobacterium haemolyticum]QOD80902.1 flagellar assembly protein FliH [Chromobacterium haemolyticum]